MIDFLNDVGISDITVNKLYNEYNSSTIFDLSCNEDECIKIINYFKELGILNIEELLLYEIDVFKLNFEKLVKKFSNFNIPLFVSMINDDYVAIEHIFDVE